MLFRSSSGRWRAVANLGAQAVSPEAIAACDVDIFAPCALGGVLNDTSVGRLRASVVAGCANNQLAAPVHGDLLAERDILYAPDYAINAGGLIEVAAQRGDYDPNQVRRQLDAISDTLQHIFCETERSGTSTHRIADAMAERRLVRKIGRAHV